MRRPPPSRPTRPRRRSGSSSRRCRSCRQPDDRRILLATRDDAFAVLRKTDERLEGLTELAALAEAMRDPAIEIDVQLRRASALRMNHDEDEAAELARRALARAAGRGDAATELRATLELGQALLRTPIGESLGAVAIEVDLDAAERPTAAPSSSPSSSATIEAWRPPSARTR